MLATWLIYHLMCGIYVGLPNGPVFFYVITLDQHVIHRRTRVINVNSQLSRSLEPTAHHPQEDRKWFTVQVEEKLREVYGTSDQGDVGSNPAQGNYSFPQKLSSVEFPVNFSQFLLNLDCESICDPPGGDALLAQGIYLTIYIYT